MPSLIDLRRRIRAVKNTQQITKAMKMVAASKLRRAQERIMNARPYAVQMQRVLADVASRVDPSLHPLLAVRDGPADRPDRGVGPGPARSAEASGGHDAPAGRAQGHAGRPTLVIVVTADKGLCGSFNTNAIKGAAAYVLESGARCLLGLVGRKGRDFFGRRGFEVRFEQVGLFQTLRGNIQPWTDAWHRRLQGGNKKTASNGSGWNIHHARSQQCSGRMIRHHDIRAAQFKLRTPGLCQPSQKARIVVAKTQQHLRIVHRRVRQPFHFG